ncbi:cupin domain-containing protein [Streptomyces gibsoniae]|uniref:Cupin domain-containing protein n=1 Tax=Streptomyces gibsoniae TaxID=3075529 RepID=A0ABU2U8V3_9ACTN|nr:cupin domain-containing protein [Streptomyces sp. DSM 41699]MDT0469646.1 cupin domain-containing protein [Streptomyces sp. DSM 41699]
MERDGAPAARPGVGPIQEFKLIVPPGRTEPDPQIHEGHMWMYVLSGGPRLVLNAMDPQVGVGESAEFSTRMAHWFGNSGPEPAKVLRLFQRQGERKRRRGPPDLPHTVRTA